MHALLCCGVVQTAQTAGRRGCLKVVEHICQVLDSVSVISRGCVLELVGAIGGSAAGLASRMAII